MSDPWAWLALVLYLEAAAAFYFISEDQGGGGVVDICLCLLWPVLVPLMVAQEFLDAIPERFWP